MDKDIKDTEKVEDTKAVNSTETTNDIEKSEEEATDNAGNESTQEESIEDQLALAKARIAELEKERLYKQAEFDNFRKRIIKEKAELILNGGRKVLEAMLPVIDDLERALQHMQSAEDIAKSDVNPFKIIKVDYKEGRS